MQSCMYHYDSKFRFMTEKIPLMWKIIWNVVIGFSPLLFVKVIDYSMFCDLIDSWKFVEWREQK